MHFYWRIQHELNCLGEFLVFRDPSFNRCFREWIRKNAGGLVLAEEWPTSGVTKGHLN